MAYEVFQRTTVRVERATLGFLPDGRIYVNAAALRLFLSAGITSVLLLWDKTQNKVAFKAAPKGDKNAYAISNTRRQSGTLAAKSFFAHIGWNARERILLDATWNQREKMLEVSLPPQYVGAGTKIGERVRKS